MQKKGSLRNGRRPVLAMTNNYFLNFRARHIFRAVRKWREASSRDLLSQPSRPTPTMTMMHHLPSIQQRRFMCNRADKMIVNMILTTDDGGSNCPRVRVMGSRGAIFHHGMVMARGTHVAEARRPAARSRMMMGPEKSVAALSSG